MNRGFDLIKRLIPFSTACRKQDNGDFLIVSNDNMEIFYLNETSSRFFLLCNGSRSVEEIVSCMLEEYDVSKDLMEADAVNLIRSFQWQQLIHLREGVETS